jgi:uncharacterized protein YkwD
MLAAILAVMLLAMLPGRALAGVRGRAAAACAGAGASAATASQQALRAAVVCLVNRERARYGLPPLRAVRSLTASAQSYTNEMVRDHFFSHTGPNGSTPGARMAAAGFHWSAAGENIASGYPTPRAVVAGWMHSQGHCYNILAPIFTDIGVGISPHPVGGAIGGATWTQDFGLPMGAHAASANWSPANSCPH